MTLGALGVVVGIPAAYFLRNGGIQGDDYTGLLAGVAGLVLLITGPVILWRNRRTDGSRRQRYRRRALAIVCAPMIAMALLWFLVFPIAVGYVYTHTAPEPAQPDLRVPYENVVVTTNDGLELTATYVPSRNRAAVVLFPGASRSEEARMLLAHGYGVLLLDPADRAAARATQCDGPATRMSWPASPTSGSVPTWTPTGWAPWGSPSAARCCCGPPHSRRPSGPSSRRAPGNALARPTSPGSPGSWSTPRRP